MKLSNFAMTTALGIMLIALIYHATIKSIFSGDDSWIAESNAREERLDQELQPYIERNKRLAQQASKNSPSTTASRVKTE